MRRLLGILLLLTWMHVANCQEVSDSSYWRTSDSLSSLAIKPIKRPKKLLKKVIARIVHDVQQKRITNKYQIEANFGEGTPTPFTACFTFSAEAGLDLEGVNQEVFPTDRIPHHGMDACKSCSRTQDILFMEWCDIAARNHR